MGHDTVSFDLQFLHDKMPEKTKKVITLSLEEKVKLIQRYEAKKSTRSVGEEFGVSKDQVRRIWAKRSAIEEEFRTSPASKRRRLHHNATKSYDFSWYFVQCTPNEPGSAPLCKRATCPSAPLCHGPVGGALVQVLLYTKMSGLSRR